MIYLVAKALLTGAIVVLISEVSKRSSFFASLLASLPLASVLAFVWMHQQGSSPEQLRDLSYGIFWMVIPSLGFFLLFPWLLKSGLRFYPALFVSCLCLSAVYWVYTLGLNKLGIEF